MSAAEPTADARTSRLDAQVRVEVLRGLTLLRVNGQFDATCAQWVEVVDHVLSLGAGAVIVDLADAVLVGDTAVTALDQLQRDLGGSGRPLVLVNVYARVRDRILGAQAGHLLGA